MTTSPPPTLPPDVADLLGTLAGLLSEDLGPGLVGLYLHGSLVAGGFAPARSDVDLLAVLAQEPDEDLLRRLARVHAEVDRAFPRWRGRVEVEYVAVATLRQHAGAGPATTPPTAPIARVSPGETLHLLPASSHRVLTWAWVHEHGRPLVGPPAREAVPAFAEDQARAALLDHVRDWPGWVRGMASVGGQAYAVLSVCRAVVRLGTGRQVSKREAAEQVAATDPGWSGLVLWARGWWYDDGPDDAPPRTAEVRRFVEETSARLLAP